MCQTLLVQVSCLGPNWGGLRGIGCPSKPYIAMCLGGRWKPRFPICARSPGFWLCLNPQPDAAGLKGSFEMLTFTAGRRGRCQQPDPDTRYTGEKMLDHLVLFIPCSAADSHKVKHQFFWCISLWELPASNCLAKLWSLKYRPVLFTYLTLRCLNQLTSCFETQPWAPNSAA